MIGSDKMDHFSENSGPDAEVGKRDSQLARSIRRLACKVRRHEKRTGMLGPRDALIRIKELTSQEAYSSDDYTYAYETCVAGLFEHRVGGLLTIRTTEDS